MYLLPMTASKEVMPHGNYDRATTLMTIEVTKNIRDDSM